MARILLATVPVIGHIAPMLPLCRALAARGHEVGWYTGATHRSHVEAAGARFFGYQHAREYDDSRVDEEFPQRGKLKGIQQLIFDMKHVFIDASTGQYADPRYNLVGARRRRFPCTPVRGHAPGPAHPR